VVTTALGKLFNSVGGGNATLWMPTAIKPQRRGHRRSEATADKQ